MDNLDSTTRTCRKCGNEYPLTEEFWYRRTDAPNAKWRNPCKICFNQRSKDHRTLNTERELEYSRRWRRNNRERDKENQRLRRLRNPEKHREYDKRYRENHPEQIRETRRKSYYKHLETNRARSRRWEANNLEYKRELRRRSARRHPESVKVRSDRRRARERNALGKYTKEDLSLIYQSQNGLCWWCGKPLEGDYWIDHRIPLSRNGSNDPSNLVASCEYCNRSKSNKMPHEWNGRLL